MRKCRDWKNKGLIMTNIQSVLSWIGNTLILLTIIVLEISLFSEIPIFCKLMTLATFYEIVVTLNKDQKYVMKKIIIYFINHLKISLDIPWYPLICLDILDIPWYPRNPSLLLSQGLTGWIFEMLTRLKIFCDYSFYQLNFSNKYFIKLLMFFIVDIIDILNIAYIFRILIHDILYILIFLDKSDIPWYTWYSCNLRYP